MSERAPFRDLPLASPAFRADPHPFYARMREAAPVCRVRLPADEEAWVVTRYDDVVALLKDGRFAKDTRNALTPEQLARQRKPPAIFAPLMSNMLGRDDPDHARLKTLVQAAFTPSRIERMATQTQKFADALLDEVPDHVPFDLVESFAFPLPVAVISELLGVPGNDRVCFARWSKALLADPHSTWRLLLAMPSMLAFLRYLKQLINSKRAEPQDDLVSALVDAEESGDRLDAEELMAMIAILLSAGHETTTHLIGSGMLALLMNPDEMERLRADPGMADSAVEELLRRESPVQMSTHRYAREDLDIQGILIPRGGLVLGAVASANRDESQFVDASTLDLGRRPNRHLTFGQGGHFCVGAALARLEARIAFNTILRRLPHLRLAVPAKHLRWRHALVLRGLSQLPLLSR